MKNARKLLEIYSMRALLPMLLGRVRVSKIIEI
jgi:hypothetical protein